MVLRLALSFMIIKLSKPEAAALVSLKNTLITLT